MFKYPFLFLIKLYQKTISLDHGFLRHYVKIRVCRFEPTCSEYTYQAIDKYGVVKGIFLGTYRILRCNPWSKGGWDPIK